MKKSILLLFAMLVSIYSIQAQSTNEVAKISANDASGNDYFSWTVAISGDFSIIGAYQDDDNGDNSGSAYIFERQAGDWTNTVQVAKLTVSDGSANDNFAYSVSISGDYAIVGAYQDDDNGNNSGSAYIFYNNSGTWEQQAKLTASDAAAEDFFGFSVSISGDYAVVGAYQDDDGGSNSGSAYVFYNNSGTWGQQAKLTASDAAADDYFAYSVCISGDNIIIGAYQDDDGGSNSGSAYIFTKPGPNWTDITQIAKLTASDAAVNDLFGYSVSISGDNAVVGAYQDDDGAGNSGSVYVYEKPGAIWSDMTQTAKLTASDASADNFLGSSVNISGDNIIAGAYQDDDQGNNSGSAYIFEKPGASWSDMTQTTKLTASDAATNDEFGRSVCISDVNALVGAHLNNEDADDSGAAYIFASPVITAHPSPTTEVCIDCKTSFNISAQGAGTFKWQVNSGGTWTDLQNNATYSGVSTDNLTITTTDNSLNGFHYWCIVTNNFGTVTSNQGTLTILDKQVPGNALEFDGNDELVRTSGVCASLNNPTTVTMECWIKPNLDPAPSEDMFFLAFNNNDYSNNIQLGINENGQLMVITGSGTGADTVNGAYLANNRWCHIALRVNDLNNAAIYLNGGVNIRTTVPLLPANNGIFTIAGRLDEDGNNANFFKGAIDEVRIWNVNRSYGQINAGMSNEISDPESVTNLITYYRFCENDGNMLHDFSAEENDGTLINSEDEDWIESYAMVYPQDLEITSGCNNLEISWDASIIGEFDSYYLEVSTGGDLLPDYDPYKDMGTETTESITGLEPGQRYYVRVRDYKTSVGDVGRIVGDDMVTYPSVEPDWGREICEGENTSFSINAPNGTNWQWEVDENGDGNFTIITDNNVYTTTSTGTLEITGADISYDGFRYRFSIDSDCGTGIYSNTVTLWVESGPEIISQPEDAEVCIGDDAFFSINSPDAASYTWQVDENGDGVYTTITENAVYNNVTTSVLRINAPNETFNENGYWCIVTNACGSKTSSSAVLTVSSLLTGITDPVDTEACTGGDAIFNITATDAAGNEGATSYQWYEIGSGTLSVSSTYPVAGSNTLELSNVTDDMDGNGYWCVASNACGSIISNTAFLTVNPGPEIIAQPIGTVACVGDPDIILTYEVSDPDPLDYQWYFEDNSISQATSSAYTIITDAANSGMYFCIVNKAGCGIGIPSDSVEILITLPAQIIMQPVTPVDSCEGDADIELFIEATGEALSYQWYQDSNSITGATSSVLSISTIPDNSGTYYCELQNVCGTLTSDNSVITIYELPEANAGEDIEAYYGEEVQLEAYYDEVYTYLWNPSDQLDNPSVYNPIFLPESSTMLLLTVNNEQCVNEDSINITVSYRTELIIYNAITPNGDGTNDTWYIDGLAPLEHEIEVRNRAGIIVFESTDYNNEWDGTDKKGRKLQGPHFYIIKVKDNPNIDIEIKKKYTGTISVLR